MGFSLSTRLLLPAQRVLSSVSLPAKVAHSCPCPPHTPNGGPGRLWPWAVGFVLTSFCWGWGRGSWRYSSPVTAIIMATLPQSKRSLARMEAPGWSRARAEGHRWPSACCFPAAVLEEETRESLGVGKEKRGPWLISVYGATEPLCPPPANPVGPLPVPREGSSASS